MTRKVKAAGRIYAATALRCCFCRERLELLRLAREHFKAQAAQESREQPDLLRRVGVLHSG